MGPLGVPLATRRLLLVPLTPALAGAALAGGPLPEGLTAVPDWPDDDAAPVLARTTLSGDGSGQWLVVLRPGVRGLGLLGQDVPPPGAPRPGVVVGECGIRARTGRDEVEVGYGLAPGSRGQGLATEAVGRLVEHLLAFSDVRAVVAHADPANTASRRLLERLGFSRATGADLADDVLTYRRAAPATDRP